jgi:hypothetical protein
VADSWAAERGLLLVMAVNEATGEVKYFATNAAAATSLPRIGRAAGVRPDAVSEEFRVAQKVFRRRLGSLDPSKPGEAAMPDFDDSGEKWNPFQAVETGASSPGWRKLAGTGGGVGGRPDTIVASVWTRAAKLHQQKGSVATLRKHLSSNGIRETTLQKCGQKKARPAGHQLCNGWSRPLVAKGWRHKKENAAGGGWLSAITDCIWMVSRCILNAIDLVRNQRGGKQRRSIANPNAAFCNASWRRTLTIPMT